MGEKRVFTQKTSLSEAAELGYGPLAAWWLSCCNAADFWNTADMSSRHYCGGRECCSHNNCCLCVATNIAILPCCFYCAAHAVRGACGVDFVDYFGACQSGAQSPPRAAGAAVTTAVAGCEAVEPSSIDRTIGRSPMK